MGNLRPTLKEWIVIAISLIFGALTALLANRLGVEADLASKLLFGFLASLFWFFQIVKFMKL
jgi:hypothetical protein